MGPSQHQAEESGRHRHRAAHDEREARIPPAEEIEEVGHLLRIHHLRDGEPDTEEQAGEEGARVLRHCHARSRWRMMNMVSAPLAMKVRVATIERGDRRDTPQIPWPLVQPLASRVPNPTSNPATKSSPLDAAMVMGTASALTRRTSPQPRINPATNKPRHSRPSLAGTSMPAMMPLMPVMRPVVISRRPAESPISPPPRSAEKGVKCSNADSDLTSTLYRYMLIHYM